MGPEWAFETGVWDLAFSPDGRTVAVGLSDGTTEIRALPQANPLGKPLDMLAGPTAFDATAEGRMAIGSGSGEVLVSDARNRPVFRLDSGQGTGNLGREVCSRRQDTGDRHRVSLQHQRRHARLPRSGFMIWTEGSGSVRRSTVGEPTAAPYRFSKDGTILYTKT